LIGFDPLHLGYWLVYNYDVHDRSLSYVSHSSSNSNPNSSLYMCNLVLIYPISIILGSKSSMIGSPICLVHGHFCSCLVITFIYPKENRRKKRKRKKIIFGMTSIPLSHALLVLPFEARATGCYPLRQYGYWENLLPVLIS